MKTLLILAVAVLLTACGKQDAAHGTSIVGQHEDCTLFRTATTSGPDITWVRCKTLPKVTQAIHKESCGKGCTREVITSTTEETK